MINPRPKKSQESDFYFPKKLIRKKKTISQLWQFWRIWILPNERASFIKGFLYVCLFDVLIKKSYTPVIYKSQINLNERHPSFDSYIMPAQMKI